MKESVCESERVADVSLNVQVRAWLRVCAAAIAVRGGRRAGKPRGSHRRAQQERVEPGGALRAERAKPGARTRGRPPRVPAPAPCPSASMRILTAALLLLLLALCAARVDGSKCKCSRKGPKIRYSDVKKLEMKPKYPHCEEKMVIITTKSVSRYRGQEHCLHPKLQSTKRFIKWYNAWNEKRSGYPRHPPIAPPPCHLQHTSLSSAHDQLSHS
ncbi:hypothetical protein J1605_014751 [Eschrichtius robustus]|uniref:Chemokine interleukin-8-like domain-containing protein n=1 Tax=Eschrichtius robustus TaxID=9764 RepID=A0AB34GE04_ESCRO|nr:hypothetical protein J1605_014751 [Eschrichtius robustus]